jgi:hypothetical protein
LKDSIEDDRSTQYPEDIDVPDLTGPELLVGGIRKASRTEILSSIPSQSIVDRLVNNFHRSQEFTSIVHAPTFREEVLYHSFILSYDDSQLTLPSALSSGLIL